MRARLQSLVEHQQAREIGSSLFVHTPLASLLGLRVDVLLSTTAENPAVLQAAGADLHALVLACRLE